jgi:hypothetical protein
LSLNTLQEQTIMAAIVPDGHYRYRAPGAGIKGKSLFL